jgi:spermidine synthase
VDTRSLRRSSLRLPPLGIVAPPRPFATDHGAVNAAPPPALDGAERLALLAGDARRYVQATDEHYDVIIAEVFHPSRDGAGALYTVEHFEAVRARLAEGGLFCQWLPLFQLDLDTLRTIVRTFVHVYPNVHAYLAHYSLGQPLLGLVAFDQPPAYASHWLQRRVQDARLARDLRAVRLDSDFALFGAFLAARDSLVAFAGDGPLNTDDRPVVAFRAPSFLYRMPEPAHVRLLSLLEALDGRPEDLSRELVQADPAFAARLAAYWQARDAYLAAGTAVRPAADPRAMLAQIEEPLFEVLGLSSDFLPAYMPLLALAQQLHGEHPAQTRRLLARLIDTSPERPEARALAQRLYQNERGSP